MSINEMNFKDKSILLTVDVEDWFQVENFKKAIRYDSWNRRESRVEKNTMRLLDILDSSGINGQKKPKATFFVLGWVAEKYPGLVREISNQGHEVASHGYMHHLCTDLSPEEISKDLTRSKILLEDITGESVWGYRAPSFNVNHAVLDIIRQCGYRYDSSYNSYGGNERYGKIDLSEMKKKGVLYELYDNFHEIPISNIKLKNRVIPWGGGGYFRLTPSFVFHAGVKNILNNDDAYVFYTHPWEIDAGQPRVENIPLSYKFRHYVNLRTCENKMIEFIDTFHEYEFLTCRSYLEIKMLNG